MGDFTNPLLGSLRSHRPGQLRANWDQGVHKVLGSHHVRELLHHQHYRAAQPPNRHDEPQLPAHLRQLGKLSIINNYCIQSLGLSQFLCLHRHRQGLLLCGICVFPQMFTNCYAIQCLILDLKH